MGMRNVDALALGLALLLAVPARAENSGAADPGRSFPFTPVFAGS